MKKIIVYKSCKHDWKREAVGVDKVLLHNGGMKTTGLEFGAELLDICKICGVSCYTIRGNRVIPICAGNNIPFSNLLSDNEKLKKNHLFYAEETEQTIGFFEALKQDLKMIIKLFQ